MKNYKENSLIIYNTLSGKKEIFKPLNEGFIGMYVCGPTVYSNVHLGNVRTFMSFDMIYRYFKHLGYKVRYVRNITDAGHLSDDDGIVENDRFIKQSRIEKLEPMEIVQKYTVDFHNVLEVFNFLPPDIEPAATGHIIEQWEIIQKLLDGGWAYVSNESVYFDVLKYNETENYGELSNRNIEELLVHSRDLEGQDEKKNPQDFALWKKANPEHIMKWKSPWGLGFPGWHLECTAMSTKYLGKQFDIHGGGLDLKFPHHECEIAQAKGSNGKTPVNYWIHTNMLTLNGQRMSKSMGNYILPMELISGENSIFDKPISPSVVRFFFMQTHYRSTLDITNDAILASEKGLQRLLESYKLIPKIITSKTSSLSIQNWRKNCYEAMNDDFNTPTLIAHLFEGVKNIHAFISGAETITKKDLDECQQTFHVFIFEILGIKEFKAKTSLDKLNKAMEVLINLRNEARLNKNWKLSDEIRIKLTEKGIILKDGTDGTVYEIN